MKLVKLVLVGAMALNTSAAFATQPAAGQTSVALQALKIQELKARYDEYKKNQAQVVTFNKAISDAQESQGTWNVVIGNGTKAEVWGMIFLMPSIGARYGVSFLKTTDFYRLGAKPLNVGILVAGLAVGTGVVTQVGGTYFLSITTAQKQAAERNLATVTGMMDTDRAAILKLSEELGARVSNNIVSFEGLPEALKILGGSNLNLNNQ